MHVHSGTIKRSLFISKNLGRTEEWLNKKEYSMCVLERVDRLKMTDQLSLIINHMKNKTEQKEKGKWRGRHVWGECGGESQKKCEDKQRAGMRLCRDRIEGVCMCWVFVCLPERCHADAVMKHVSLWAFGWTQAYKVSLCQGVKSIYWFLCYDWNIFTICKGFVLTWTNTTSILVVSLNQHHHQADRFSEIERYFLQLAVFGIDILVLNFFFELGWTSVFSFKSGASSWFFSYVSSG